MKKQRRVNQAKKLVAEPRFRSRVEKPVKGPAAYRRKAKHPGGDSAEES
jgi:stalled ribosome alternative rescue factor ArfA